MPKKLMQTPYIDIIVRRADGDLHPLLHYAASVTDVFAYMDALRFMERLNQRVIMVIEPIHLDEFNTHSYISSIKNSYDVQE